MRSDRLRAPQVGSKNNRQPHKLDFKFMEWHDNDEI